MSVPLDQFVNLSSALTGVTAQQLKPDLDPIGIADQYLKMLQQQRSDALDLLNTFEAQTTALGSADKAAAFILADSTFGPVARSIIKMWLLGSWYDPLKPTNAIQVVSSQAYKESLVWKVMQSHPMGYSMFSFGYWAAAPPPYKEFILPPGNGGTTNGSN